MHINPFPCFLGYPFGAGFGGCHSQGVFRYRDPWEISGYASFIRKFSFLFQFHPDNLVFRVCHFFASVELWQFVDNDLECDS